MKKINIKNANIHNLKNVSVEIPRNSFTVITGPSGSGKSSLAFDTLYAEGQRRYLESLTSYAKQAFVQITPPNVEKVTGLSPTIAIDQKTINRNPRSTVGTTTEIYDYLRILFAKLGLAHCPISGEEIHPKNKDDIVSEVLAHPEGTKIQILAPVVKSKKGKHKELFDRFASMGFNRIRLNGLFQEIDNKIKINGNTFNDIDLVIDRIILKKQSAPRIEKSINYALNLADGDCLIEFNGKEVVYFSQNYYSQKSQKSYPRPEPRHFSFNSPLGYCPDCKGLGFKFNINQESLIIDDTKSIKNGAVEFLDNPKTAIYQMLKTVAQKQKIDLDVPFKSLSKEKQNIIFFGIDHVFDFKIKTDNYHYQYQATYDGLIPYLETKFSESNSELIRFNLESFFSEIICETCKGQKLNSYSLAVKINNKNISNICEMQLNHAYDFCKNLQFKGNSAIIAEKLLKEILSRLKFLNNVGLSYLTLNRLSKTLSGGEAQRIRLATQLGSQLSGVLYVLDEPSIGLHQRDNIKLLDTLIDLKNLGNTVVVVEHDEETIRRADYVIDMGPGAGIHGGNVIFEGKIKNKNPKKSSTTLRYLFGERVINQPSHIRPAKNFVEITGAQENNLANLDIKIPLSVFCCITGVSGSGKSTMVHQVFIPAIRYKLGLSKINRLNYQSIKGYEQIESIIKLDQSPIGRTPKSNPVTYAGVFDQIRNIFANTSESKIRGYSAGHFSFNVNKGRCTTCEGAGVQKIEMAFLADTYITCSACSGKRYSDDILAIHYRSKNIFDVLNMSFEEAALFFTNHPKLKRTFELFCEIGLGYMTLGQPSTTLSGGEAQRLKLAKELSKLPKGQCLYILDEPTTGLHFVDIQLLINALHRLVDAGHSIVVVEHNLDVIKNADYIIDMGPEGGDLGGQLVAYGEPKNIIKNKKSITGRYLKEYFKTKDAPSK